MMLSIAAAQFMRLILAHQCLLKQSMRCHLNVTLICCSAPALSLPVLWSHQEES